jgi:hypothetical protein
MENIGSGNYLASQWRELGVFFDQIAVQMDFTGEHQKRGALLAETAFVHGGARRLPSEAAITLRR